MKRASVLVVAFVSFVLLTHLEISQDHIYLAIRSDDGRFIARIVKRRPFPYLSIDSLLQVQTLTDNEVKRVQLLTNRDEGDLESEIQSLHWEGEFIVIQAAGRLYTGPTRIPVRE